MYIYFTMLNCDISLNKIVIIRRKNIVCVIKTSPSKTWVKTLILQFRVDKETFKKKNSSSIRIEIQKKWITTSSLMVGKDNEILCKVRDSL